MTDPGVIAGDGLAFINLWFATLVVIGIGAWHFWNYHGALQCDQCGEYFISGPFARRGARRRPRTKADAKVLLFRWCVVSLIGGLDFLSFYLVDRSLDKGCSATCAERGLLHKSNLIGLQCVCDQKGEAPQMRKSTNPRNIARETESR